MGHMAGLMGEYSTIGLLKIYALLAEQFGEDCWHNLARERVFPSTSTFVVLTWTPTYVDDEIVTNRFATGNKIQHSVK